MSNSISLSVSEDMIKECINDLYVNPKKSIVKWSKITNQTAQGKFAYPSQHLASLITKTKGKGSAARGDDLADGSEVKSCSRADQLNECKNCGHNMIAWEEKCPDCGSTEIKRDTSSHWIFPIREKKELDLLLNRVPRIILVLFDKENLTKDEVRIRAWVVNPKEGYVKDFFTNYYEENYMKRVKRGEKPAPCNLHPLKFDFYKMKPRLIFHAKITETDVEIIFWDLEHPKLELMPIGALKKKEVKEIFEDESIEKIEFVPEEKMGKIKMRNKILKKYKEAYKRR